MIGSLLTRWRKSRATKALAKEMAREEGECIHQWRFHSTGAGAAYFCDLCGEMQSTSVKERVTTGVRNNNYLNVKGRGWKGQVGVDSRGHAVFRSPEWGLRAAIITLRTYWFKHGLRTVAEILSRWAPSSDTIGSLPGAPPNSPRDYAEFVQKRTGLDPNAVLKIFQNDRRISEEDTLADLLAAMAEYENYSGFRYPRSSFDRAIQIL